MKSAHIVPASHLDIRNINEHNSWIGASITSVVPEPVMFLGSPTLAIKVVHHPPDTVSVGSGVTTYVIGHYVLKQGSNSHCTTVPLVLHILTADQCEQLRKWDGLSPDLVDIVRFILHHYRNNSHLLVAVSLMELVSEWDSLFTWFYKPDRDQLNVSSEPFSIQGPLVCPLLEYLDDSSRLESQAVLIDERARPACPIHITGLEKIAGSVFWAIPGLSVVVYQAIFNPDSFTSKDFMFVGTIRLRYHLDVSESIWYVFSPRSDKSLAELQSSLDGGQWLLPTNVSDPEKCWPYVVKKIGWDLMFENQFLFDDVLHKLRAGGRRANFTKWFNLDANGPKRLLRCYWDTENLCPVTTQAAWEVVGLVSQIAKDCGLSPQDCVINVFHRQTSSRKLTDDAIRQFESEGRQRHEPQLNGGITVHYVTTDVFTNKGGQLDLRLGMVAASDFSAYQNDPFICLILSSDCDFGALNLSPNVHKHALVTAGLASQRSARLSGPGFAFIPLESYTQLINQALPELRQPDHLQGQAWSSQRGPSNFPRRSTTPRSRNLDQSGMSRAQKTADEVVRLVAYGTSLSQPDAQHFRFSASSEKAFLHGWKTDAILHTRLGLCTDDGAKIPVSSATQLAVDSLLRSWTARRPVRTANDLARPF